mmetsp:Transcript_35376/g.85614  ORF Transcript_35376/g.85614 Transcript_35376/m.85614 type:complete len:703 (-) Transcript_35376:107-2215(-)
MPQIGLFLLVNIFSALLPSIDTDEKSYYDILGVEKTASNEEIRKAYKKLSLRLHPDKLAQSGANDEERERAAKEYEGVQEAYEVLVNDEKREKYDILKTPTRYQFVVERGAMASPGAIYQNLTSASFTDKTKLVGCTTTLIILILLQPILIAAKLNQTLEQDGKLEFAKWVIIFIPTWIFFGAFIIFNAVLIKLIPPSQRLPMIIWTTELILWFLGLLFLTLRWDGTWTSDYRQVLTPVYLAFTARLIGMIILLKKVRGDVQRMVTSSFLETNILKGKSLDDMTDEEKEELKREYLVVSVPDDFVPVLAEDGVELDEAKIEEQRVEASPEFEGATEIYNGTFMSVVTLCVFGTIFLILLTRKLDGKTSGSWWVVFIPIWIWLVSRLLVNFYRCACGTVASDEILLHMNDMKEQAGEGEGNDDEASKHEDIDKKQTDEEQSSGIDIEKSAEDKSSSSTEDESKKKETAKDHATSNEKAESKSPATKQKEDDNTGSKDESADIETGKKNEGEDDADYIHVDEETFRAWQSAYEHAEETAMQEQARACTECCNITVQLLILCLIVAKIEKNWNNLDPNDTGFNTFWILFPVFLSFGLVCCCCACLIYGAAPGDAADLDGGAGAGEDENSEVGTDEAATGYAVVVPPHDEKPATNVPSDEFQDKTGTFKGEGGNTASEPTPQKDDVVDVESPNEDVPESTGMDDLD